MTDRFVTVPDSLEIPADVKVPSARLSDSTAAGRALLDAADAAAQRTALGLGTAATTPATDYATAAQGAKADAGDVAQITLTGNLALTIPEGHPAGQVYRCAITQTTGGHTVTYSGASVTVDTTAGASTQIELRPTGSGWAVAYPPAVATATAAQGALADSAIQAADLTSPQALQLNPLATAQRGAAPRILTLAVGTEDETAQGYMTKGTIAADTDNYRYGGRGWKITNNPGETYFKWVLNKPAPGATTPLATPAWQAMCMWVYIYDATKVTNLQVNIYHSADLSATYRWLWAANTAPTTTLVTGWNFIRIPASFSSNNPTRNIYQVELLVGVNADDASVTIGHWYLECPSKARFILTADRGYQTFYANIYPEMKARNWPVTFAVDCMLFGTGSGITSVMSLADMKTCAAENGNSISFHGWDGSPTSAMTEAQLRTDTLRSIKFLQREFPNSLGRFWRAAFVQNSAAQRAAVYDYLLAAAAGGADNLGPTMWPPNNWYHIRRWSLDNYKTLGNIADLFTQAQATHLTYNVFVHGYDSTTPGWDVDSTRWALFRDSLDAAVAAGWAEVVTFEQLFLESGGTFSTSGGATVAEYTDATGARVVKSLL